MSDSKLPERASLEYLKKLAKDRLHELRQTDPHTKLAAALLAVARDHGFPSWRALKIEVEQRQATTAAVFFEACANGGIARLRAPSTRVLGKIVWHYGDWDAGHYCQRSHLPHCGRASGNDSRKE